MQWAAGVRLALVVYKPIPEGLPELDQ